MHIALHFIIPAIITSLYFRPHWKATYTLMIVTMLVDIDHLLATPIYDPTRCSIGFHPLHTFLPIGFYVLLCFPKKTRYIGIGLCIHMLLDSIDCQVTNSIWFTS